MAAIHYTLDCSRETHLHLLTILSFLCLAFVDGEDPDQDYIDAALPIIKQHMMLGANRLAALMVDIYGSSERAANFITREHAANITQ